MLGKKGSTKTEQDPVHETSVPFDNLHQYQNSVGICWSYTLAHRSHYLPRHHCTVVSLIVDRNISSLQ